MAQVTVNHIVGSFLIRYDETKQSEQSIKALFRVLSDKYLNDADMLASVTLPPKRASLPESLISMAVWHYAKRLLPPPLGSILQLASIAPRVLKGGKRIFSGRVFCADVLDATAITAAAATGDMSTASNINFLLDIGETIEEYTKKKSYEDLASTLFSENDQVQLVEGETERKVPLYTLKKGDIVAVRQAGQQDRAPCDRSRARSPLGRSSLEGAATLRATPLLGQGPGPARDRSDRPHSVALTPPHPARRPRDQRHDLAGTTGHRPANQLTRQRIDRRSLDGTGTSTQSQTPAPGKHRGLLCMSAPRPPHSRQRPTRSHTPGPGPQAIRPHPHMV